MRSVEEAYCVKVTLGPGQWPPPLSLSEPEPESLSVRGSSAGEQTEKQDIRSVTLVSIPVSNLE